MAESPKLLDLLHNGVKIGDVPDSVPVAFENDKACSDFLDELKTLDGLPNKYKLTIERCQTALSSENDTEVDFGPQQILQMAELAFRYPAKGSKIMSVVQYLLGCLDFTGTLPPNIFADLGSTFGMLGSIMNKPVGDDDDNADLDDDEKFGYELDGDDSENEFDEESEDE